MASPSPAPKFRMPPLPPTLLDLPPNVIDEILVRIPIRDAVRTSALSRSWRHRWHSIPDLVLEGIRHTPLPPTAVDHVLLLHSAPIRLFSLYSTQAPDRWLLSLSRRCTAASQALASLSFSFFGFNRDDYPLLHSSVFSFLSITSLSLTHCSISLPPPDRFPGFTALRSLFLQAVDFREDRQLPVLLSLCPSLEELTLLGVELCGRLSIPQPNLRSFRLHSDCCEGVSLGTGQTLDTLYVALGGGAETDVSLDGLFSGIVCNDLLILHDSTVEALLKGGSIPESIPNSFQQLRSLSIMVDLVDTGHISLMLCLMRSAPNLQELCLVGLDYGEPGYDEDESGPGEDFWNALQNLEMFAKLQTVRMCYIMFQEPEVEFMKFILARARVLKTLTITSTFGTARNHESVLAELRMFHRASAPAQIIYEEQDEDTTED